MGQVATDASILQHSRRRMVRDFKAPRFEGDGIFSPVEQRDRDIDDDAIWAEFASPVFNFKYRTTWFRPAGDDGPLIGAVKCAQALGDF